MDIVQGKSAGRSQELEQGSRKLCKISVLENRSQDTLVMVVPASYLDTGTNWKKPSHRTPWPSSVCRTGPALNKTEPAGTTLGSLSATDAEERNNARMRYALEPAPQGAPAAASFLSWT